MPRGARVARGAPRARPARRPALARDRGASRAGLRPAAAWQGDGAAAAPSRRRSRGADLLDVPAWPDRSRVQLDRLPRRDARLRRQRCRARRHGAADAHAASTRCADDALARIVAGARSRGRTRATARRVSRVRSRRRSGARDRRGRRCADVAACAPRVAVRAPSVPLLARAQRRALRVRRGRAMPLAPPPTFARELGALYRCRRPSIVSRGDARARCRRRFDDRASCRADVDCRGATRSRRCDPDVLLDLAGLRAAGGPLLARRPARERWALPSMPCRQRRRSCDRTVDATVASRWRRWSNALATRKPRRVSRRLRTQRGGARGAVGRRGARASAQRHARRRARLCERAGRATRQRAALYLSGAACARRGRHRRRARRRSARRCGARPAFVDARAALSRLAMLNGSARRCSGRRPRRAGGFAAMRRRCWRALRRRRSSRAAMARAAATAFDAALARDPADGETHYNHGVALQMARAAEAARAYQRALAFKPDLLAADFNLGVIFDQQGNAAAAIAAFSQRARARAEHAAAYKALAETLLAAGRIDAWLANFERFEANCPTHVGARGARARSVRLSGRLPASRPLPRRTAQRAVRCGRAARSARCARAAPLPAALLRRRARARRAHRPHARRAVAPHLRRAPRPSCAAQAREDCASATCRPTFATT